MIYSVVGTNATIRQKALKEFLSLGQVSRHLYSDEAVLLETYLNAMSLFGEVVVIGCVQLSGAPSSKEILVSLLPKMEQSSTVFLVDEPFADTHLITKLEKVSKKLFNAKEEKGRDTDVFPLCDAFAKRDKKEAWKIFMSLRGDVEGEAIQGALWWKFQGLWQSVKDGKKTAFTQEECERIGGELVRSTVRAHRGERDLLIELERIILAI